MLMKRHTLQIEFLCKQEPSPKTIAGGTVKVEEFENLAELEKLTVELQNALRDQSGMIVSSATRACTQASLGVCGKACTADLPFSVLSLLKRYLRGQFAHRAASPKAIHEEK
jgi:hypothetical protein